MMTQTEIHKIGYEEAMRAMTRYKVRLQTSVFINTVQALAIAVLLIGVMT